MKTFRCGSHICTVSGFAFLLGVNYWPRKLNIRMWHDWDENTIAEDCKKIKDLGFRVVRIFIKDEDFADEDAEIREEPLKKLERLLDILAENGLYAFITFIVGHMSGKNWRIPWTSFDELYTSKSIERTMRFIRGIVERVKDHKAVAGWILSNELSLVKRASSREEALAMLKAFAYTVKSIDKDHVISSGDIIDSYMQETYNVEGVVDYIGPHIYLYDNDPIRHSHLYATLVELSSNAQTVPVIVEEFGFSTHQFSEESHARFVNDILYTILSRAASGAFIWCFSDFVQETDPPYEWRPLELGFGVIKRDGFEKKVADVIRRFSSELNAVESLGLNTKFKRLLEAYVVAPFYLWKDYEFVYYKELLTYFNVVRPVAMAYALLTASSVPTGIVYELSLKLVEDKAKLLLLPSAVVSLASTWRRLLDLTAKGVSVYASFTRGVFQTHALHEAPTHLWAELFGVESSLQAGAIGRRINGRILVEFAKSFGSIKGGEKLYIDVPMPIYVYKARTVDAEVVAYDNHGEPVIFAAKRGKAKTFLSLIPIEIVLALTEEVDWLSGVHRFYESMALEANIQRPYVSKDPRVDIQVFRGEDLDLIIAVNHSYNNIGSEIMAGKSVKSITRLGGDAKLISWSSNSIKVEFEGKSAIILLVS